MPVTVKQIAEACGVSRPTVSLILNGRGDRYHVDTQRRVHAVAQRMGYLPNGSARALAMGAAPTGIGLLTSTTPHLSVVSNMIPGIQRALRERNLHLTVAELPDQKLTDSGFVPKILREYSVGGFLVGYTHGVPPAMLELVKRHNIPTVWLNTKRPSDCVYVDDFGAFREATARLIRLGHRRIAYVATHLSGHYSHADRADGYARAMCDAGLTPIPLRATVADAEDAMVPRLAAALDAADRPTAFITYGSHDAAAIAHLALLRGLRVPDDVSLLTAAGEAVTFGIQKIATLRLPFADLGEAGVDMLLKRVAHPTRRIRSKPLSPTLVDEDATVRRIAR